jgi:hypothetical protein
MVVATTQQPTASVAVEVLLSWLDSLRLFIFIAGLTTMQLTPGCRDPRLNRYLQAENKTPCSEVDVSITTIWLPQICPTVNCCQYLLRVTVFERHPLHRKRWNP